MESIPITIIPNPVFNIEFIPKRIQNTTGIYRGPLALNQPIQLKVGVEIPPIIELMTAKAIVVQNISQTAFTRIELTVTSNNQTQFNIFNAPLAEHWLLVNGIEEYENDGYLIEQVGSNWRLVWLNSSYQLKIGMKLIFCKK